MTRRTLRIIYIALGATLAVLLGVLIFILVRGSVAERNAERQESSAELEMIKNGLTAERVNIERELNRLSAIDADRLATVTLLFRTPSEIIYDSIRPNMIYFGMSGTICLSLDSLPSDNGNMSVRQFENLIDEGYSSAVLYDGTLPLADYLLSLSDKLAGLEIAFPETLYICIDGDFGDGVRYLEYDEENNPIFTEEYEAICEQYGIKYTVQETYESDLVNYCNLYEDFRYTEAIGFVATRYIGSDAYGLAAASLYEAMKSGGSVVFSVCFENLNHYGYGAYYGTYSTGGVAGKDDGTTTDDFMKMLNTLSGFDNELTVTDMKGTEEYRKSYNAQLPDAAELEARRAEYEARLAAIDEEIRKIKDKYK